MIALGLAFLAGLLSTLSPCVLPLLPLVLGAAAAQHRFGRLALAAGLALAFVSSGLFLASIGFAVGLDSGPLRLLGAILMVAIGLALIMPALQGKLALAGSPMVDWAGRRMAAIAPVGLRGQFALGLLIGLAWSPCVGPTLGAAVLLAAEGKDIFRVALTMLLFGLGAAAPLIALGAFSARLIGRLRAGLLATGRGGRTALGAMLLAIGATIATGMDKRLEALLVEASPRWLTELTTSF